MEMILSSIIIGIITGVASSWLSLVVFRAQRVWERKEAAYKELLEALQQMKAANDEEWQDEITYRRMSSERRAYLAQQWKAGKVIAYKYADIGSVNPNCSF